MERPRRHRRLAIASLSVGAVVAFTVPTLVSAGPTESAGEETATSVPNRSPETEAPSTTSGTTGSDTSTTAAPTTSAPLPVEAPQVAPAPPVVAEPAPTTSAPAPTPVEAAPPAPVAEEAQVVEGPATTGSLTVEVAPASGASRQVSLRTAAGEPIAGPVTVDGGPITFADLTPGDHDLYVEHFADGGGTFLTRTPITIVAGSELLATCDAETLDCTVG